VQNIVEGTSHDVWEVNVEEDYHESGGRPAGAGAPGTGADDGDLPGLRPSAA
jgi:hypothetical protein